MSSLSPRHSSCRLFGAFIPIGKFMVTVVGRFGITHTAVPRIFPLALNTYVVGGIFVYRRFCIYYDFSRQISSFGGTAIRHVKISSSRMCMSEVVIQ